MQVTLASLTLAQKCAKALKEKTSPSLDYIIMRERRTRRHLFRTRIWHTRHGQPGETWKSQQHIHTYLPTLKYIPILISKRTCPPKAAPNFQ